MTSSGYAQDSALQFAASSCTPIRALCLAPALEHYLTLYSNLVSHLPNLPVTYGKPARFEPLFRAKRHHAAVAYARPTTDRQLVLSFDVGLVA